MKRLPATGMVLAFLGACVLMPACTRQQVPAVGADDTGRYVLVSVNGNDVPTSVSHGGVSVMVNSGVFEIDADGTCRSKTVFVPPSGSEIEREVAATYKRDGSTLTMKWEGAGMTVGTLEGGTFTMDNEGMVFVYRK